MKERQLRCQSSKKEKRGPFSVFFGRKVKGINEPAETDGENGDHHKQCFNRHGFPPQSYYPEKAFW
jgi:hypothetical protein